MFLHLDTEKGREAILKQSSTTCYETSHVYFYNMSLSICRRNVKPASLDADAPLWLRVHPSRSSVWSSLGLRQLHDHRRNRR